MNWIELTLNSSNVKNTFQKQESEGAGVSWLGADAVTRVFFFLPVLSGAATGACLPGNAGDNSVRGEEAVPLAVERD